MVRDDPYLSYVSLSVTHYLSSQKCAHIQKWKLTLDQNEVKRLNAVVERERVRHPDLYRSLGKEEFRARMRQHLLEEAADKGEADVSSLPASQPTVQEIPGRSKRPDKNRLSKSLGWLSKLKKRGSHPREKTVAERLEEHRAYYNGYSKTSTFNQFLKPEELNDLLNLEMSQRYGFNGTAPQNQCKP